MTPITLQLIKKPAIYGMILLFSRYFAMSYDMLRVLFYNLMGHFVYNISISPLTMTLNEAHQFTHHLWSVPPSTQAFPGAVGVYALIVSLCSLWMSSAVTCVSK